MLKPYADRVMSVGLNEPRQQAETRLTVFWRGCEAPRVVLIVDDTAPNWEAESLVELLTRLPAEVQEIDQ
jgi:hypothetical protein